MDQPEEGRPISENPFLTTLCSDDQQLLKRLYLDSFSAVRQFVIHNSGTEDDARDIYQEAFLATWRNVQLARFSPEHERAFSAYLLGVGKNKWIDELRKRKTSMNITQENARYGSGESYDPEIDEYILAVRKHYGNLGERCRELLGRFYFRKQRLRDIATHFGWTEASAKNNKYRCLKELRGYLMKGQKQNG